MDDRTDLSLAAAIIQSAKDYAIFTLNADGVVTSWSAGAEAVIGYSETQAIGLEFSTFYTEADRAAGAPEMAIAEALETGRAVDTRWRVRRDGELFWANGVMIRMDQRPGMLLKVLRDETAAHRADEQRILLLHELNHRINNTLATVQSITDQTLRGADVDPKVRSVLVQRLRAISEAHNVLVDDNWAGADLHAIIAATLSPFEMGQPKRLLKSGPVVRLAPNQAVSVSLALHELATNAVKYGALGPAGGRVRLTWNVAQDGEGNRQLVLLWVEEGGPQVRPSGRRGFGMRLLERTFEHEGCGEAKIEMLESGVRCSMVLQLVDDPEGRFLDPREHVPALARRAAH